VSKSKGTAHEDIGRPGPWTENRYQQPGKSVDNRVDDTGHDKTKASDKTSRPVTLEDYTGEESES